MQIINLNYDEVMPNISLINESNGRWQWYLDGEFDEGNFM
jgi:hypothetical protein